MGTEIRPGQVVIAAALPMPLDGVQRLNQLVETMYGTGDFMLDFSGPDVIRIIAPKTGFGPRKTGRAMKLPNPDEHGALRSIQVVDDQLQITFEEAQDVVLALGTGLAAWFELSGGINYVTAQVMTAGEVATPLHITVQRTGNPTAHDLRAVAEDRVAVLEQQLRELGHEPAQP